MLIPLYQFDADSQITDELNIVQKAFMRYGYLLIPLLALLLQGCGTLDYYSHTLSGHLRLMSGREPIDDVLADCANDKSLCERLQLARQIRDFASEELHLPNNGSYRSYAALDRPFAVWAVFAAPEFSLLSNEWCFPIAGCVPYRGYFSESKAQLFAHQLEAEKQDVYIGGVMAYSSLGWFDDPLLSTMLRGGETDIAGLIFHELAHQQVYVKGDSAYNEAFATAVQEAGVRLWLKRNGTEADSLAYEQSLERNTDFFDLVETTRSELQILYQRSVEPDLLRAEKQRVIARMRERYVDLKKEWGGYSGYDWWFDQPINNAKLASVAIYYRQVPDFLRLFELCGCDFERLYRAVEWTGNLAAETRNDQLKKIDNCRVDP